MNRLYIPLLTVALATPACQPTDRNGLTGRAELRLTSQAQSGRTYRLRHADFDIAGRDALVLHSEDDPSRTAIDFDVPAGDYTLTIAPGWYLERVDAGGAIAVNASLLSPSPLPFTIQNGAVTPIALRFRVDADVVDMGRGTGEVTIDVDDTVVSPVPAIQCGPVWVALDEGSEGPIPVWLSARPAAPVVVSVTAGPGITVSPSTITFTPDDWSTAQLFTVTAAVDDDDHDDDFEISLHAPGATPFHVGVHVFDRDGQRVVLTRSSTLMFEGTAVENSVRLRRAPSQPVTVRLAANRAVSVSPSTVTFTPDNYDIAQPFTITAARDADTAEELALVTATADEATSTMVVRVLDADVSPTQNIIVDGATTVIDEGGSLVGMVQLMMPPTSPVVVHLDTGAGLTVSPGELTFTADNWNVRQPVTLTAAEDDDTFDDTVPAGAGAAGLARVVFDITVLDNDQR